MKSSLWSTLPAALAICGLHFLHPRSALAANVTEIESNDSVAAAQNLDGFFSLEENRAIGTRYEATSTLLPHVTVLGTGDGTLDYFSFTAKQGDRLVLDADYPIELTSMLQLFSSNGELLATGYPDDPAAGGIGTSEYYTDAFLEFTAPETGRYVVALGAAYNMQPIPVGSSYVLHISAGSPHAKVFSASDFISKELPGVVFSSIGNPTIGASGTLAFQAKMKAGTGGVTSANDVGVFGHVLRYVSGSGSSGSAGPRFPRLEIIAQEGDVAAGTSSAVFAKFNDPICNSNGVTAFRGTLKIEGDVTNTNDTGIWSNQRGVLELVAREGEQAPGTSTGTLFHSFTALVLPDRTGVAFLAKLRVGTGDATSKNNVGVWAVDADGNLNLVIRKGMELNFEGAPRTLSSFAIFNSSSGVVGQSRHFTPAGSLLYRAKFSGGGAGLFRYIP